MRSFSGFSFCLLSWLLLLGCSSIRPVGKGAAGVAIAPEPFQLLAPLFRDGTADLGMSDMGASYVNWLDYNRDGFPDLLLNGRRLFRNDAGRGFVDVSDATGMTGSSSPALAVDMDNDGWVDIVTARGAVWGNREGMRFENIAERLGFAPGDKGNVIGAGDIDGDGFVDLYIGMKEDWNSGDARYYAHQLWHNRAGAALAEIGERAGIARKSYARSVLFSDVNHDGLVDIFVGNYRLQANLLWINRGDCHYSDAAARYGVQGRKTSDTFLDPVTRKQYGFHYGHTIGACWLDIENDGDQDLFTANLVHKYVGPSGLKGLKYDIRGYVCDDSGVFLRQGDCFVESRETLGLSLMPIGGRGVYKGDELWAGAVAADVNNDGWQDVFVPQIYNLAHARALLLMNSGGEYFDDRAVPAGIDRIDTYAGAWADIDGDGWLDLATAGRPAKGEKPALVLYLNQTGFSEGNGGMRWVAVSLDVGKSVKTTVGSRVSVICSGVMQVREYFPGTSTYGQQNGPVLHFGLGRIAPDADVVVSIEWPDGGSQRLQTFPGRKLMVVRKN